MVRALLVAVNLTAGVELAQYVLRVNLPVAAAASAVTEADVRRRRPGPAPDRRGVDAEQYRYLAGQEPFAGSDARLEGVSVGGSHQPSLAIAGLAIIASRATRAVLRSNRHDSIVSQVAHDLQAMQDL